MQAMRDLLRTSLGKSLATLSAIDRVAAAWPVTAGHATAERTSVESLENSVVSILVPDIFWRNQLEAIAQQLRSDLARISRVPLTAILFVLPIAEKSAHSSAIPSRRKPA
jgi:predicted nucleic acid-binding Zn ribbon protein